MSDVLMPHDDPHSLVGENWPRESESAYHAAETDADALSTTAGAQAESAGEASRQTETGMQGETADSVSSAYAHLATQLLGQSRDLTAISGWMVDAASEIRKAKKRIVSLVRSGTSEIRDALDSELRGTLASPSSSELTDKYRGEIAQAATQLTADLDSIGHSLQGDPGSSRTPTYVRAASTPTTPTVEHSVHQGITGDPNAPAVEPQRLPEMPRATTTHTDESPSTPTAPAVVTPHGVNPTLANLVGGQGGTPNAGTPSGTSTPHTSSPSTPSTQAHQSTEQHQTSKAPALPRIPNIPLDGLPAAAAETIATAVSSAAAHQLSTAPSTITPSVPVSTGITPGVPGTSPMTPVAPGGLAPIGGGGLSAPAVTQPATSAPQAAPAGPTTPSPTPTRSPVADLGWIQRTYGLASGIETPKSETVSLPALFIADLSESEAHLHRVLASLRQQFESTGWSQPLAVANLRKGLESRLVYVTADSVSTHPQGVSLPTGLTPLDEIPSTPIYPELSGSLIVTDKLKALLPRGWELEGLLSTLPSDESHQSAEQYRELVGAGELLSCTLSRGRDDVEPGEAMSVFARAALGSAGCSELDSESSRLRSARWVGVQPAGYLDGLSRYHLSDAADSMSQGNWGEAVYASEKYLGLVEPKSQAA